MAGYLKFLVYIAFFVCIISTLVELVDNNDSKSNLKVKKLQIGIKKRIEGCEVKSKKGDVLHMHYKGMLEDGTEFDNSYKRGEPLSFTLGSGQVIRGWDQGLLKMCEGEKRKLIIPPDLGYGSAGAPPTIPGDSVLMFEVELVKIERKTEL